MCDLLLSWTFLLEIRRAGGCYAQCYAQKSKRGLWLFLRVGPPLAASAAIGAHPPRAHAWPPVGKAKNDNERFSRRPAGFSPFELHASKALGPSLDRAEDFSLTPRVAPPAALALGPPPRHLASLGDTWLARSSSSRAWPLPLWHGHGGRPHRLFQVLLVGAYPPLRRPAARIRSPCLESGEMRRQRKSRRRIASSF